MYRVVDLSRLLPGPYATLCLAGLGMEVIKVEEPTGDYLRHFPPLEDGTGRWFTALNRGKKSVTLNLKRAEDRARLLRLLDTADVLVESFRPGVLARLSLDPDALAARYPRLVLAHLTGWGQSGPYRDLPGHDLGFMGLAGLLTPPHLPPLQWADLAAGGLLAALRITAALLDRAHTGQGARLDIAMLDGLIALQPARFAAPDEDLLTGGNPAYGLYPCADGWLSVAALEPQFSGPLQQIVGDLTRENLSRAFLSDTRAAWAARLGHLCVTPVLSPAEVIAHPHVQARDLFAGGLPHPPTGPVKGAAPRLGEHDALFP